MLRVDHRQRQIVQNAKLLEVLWCEVSEFHVKFGDFTLGFVLLRVVENALIWVGQLTWERHFIL